MKRKFFGLFILAGISLFNVGITSCTPDPVSSSSSSLSSTSSSTSQSEAVSSSTSSDISSSSSSSESSSSSIAIDETTSTNVSANVGDVITNQISVSAKVADGDVLNFDANYVEDGRVSAESPNDHDDLKINLEITVTGDSSLWNTCLINFTSSSKENGDNAVSKNYVKLPNNLTLSQEDLTIKENNNKQGLDSVITYSLELEYSWGEVFNFKNPAEYYSNDDEGKLVSIDTVTSTLSNMQQAIKNTNFGIEITIQSK